MQVQFSDYIDHTDTFYNAVIKGLSLKPKSIPPKFLYDRKGSELFEAICKTPEYYIARKETSILKQNINEIADLASNGCTLIDLGSGSSKKVRLLLEVLYPEKYIAVDISKEFLLEATNNLSLQYPHLDIHAVCTDYAHLLQIPQIYACSKKLFFFPGSTIGNFDRKDAIFFLKQLKELSMPDGALIIGVDLKKDAQILHAAFNDSEGVTVKYNLNLLNRIINELGAKLNINFFKHKAFYNFELGRLEAHLYSLKDQDIKIDKHVFHLDEGEMIHTTNSYKYTIDEFRELASLAGFKTRKIWTDKENYFSIFYLD